MRKIKFLSVSTALFAVGMLATSCFTSDDPVSGGGSGSSESPKTAVVTDIEGAGYSILATSNLAADYSIDVTATPSSAKNKTVVNFTDITKSSATVTVEYTGDDAADYVNAKQSFDVAFSDKTTSASLNFVFVKSSPLIPWDDAVDAVTKNKDITVTSASIYIPEGTTPTGDVTGGVGITAYKRTAETVDSKELTVGSTIDGGGWVLNCQPSGVKFDKAVELTVYVGKSLAGMTLTLQYAGDESDKQEAEVDEDGYVTFEVSHFSDWLVIKEFEVVEPPVTTSDILDEISLNAVAGENTFNYNKKVGCDIDLNKDNYKFIYDQAKGSFGDEASEVKEEVSFTAEGAGVAKIVVSQNKTTYKLRCGNVLFTLTHYEDVNYTISINGTTHSGGSGK